MDEEPSLLPHNNDETTPLVVQSEGDDLEENDNSDNRIGIVQLFVQFDFHSLQLLIFSLILQIPTFQGHDHHPFYIYSCFSKIFYRNVILAAETPRKLYLPSF